MSLPSPRTFLTSLITSIPTPTTPLNTSNPLISLRGSDRNSLLTLHVLFPNDFLPALDLLDRGLVTRLREQADNVKEDIRKDDEATDSRTEEPLSRTENATPSPPPNSVEPHHTHHPSFTTPKSVFEIPSVYYVRSAQTPRTHHTRQHAPPLPTYEVHLHAWNCSCAAFAFASFPSILPNPEQEVEDMKREPEQSKREDERGGGDWKWGGLRLGRGSVPVCKHLLACVLVERCEVFKECVVEIEGTVEEMAGWAGGWGREL